MALYDNLKPGETIQIGFGRQIQRTDYKEAIHNVRDSELKQGTIVVEAIEQTLGKENVFGLGEFDGYNTNIIPSERQGNIGCFCCDGDVIGAVVEVARGLSETDYKKYYGTDKKDSGAESTLLEDRYIRETDDKHRRIAIIPCNIFVPNSERNRSLLLQLGLREIPMPVLVNGGSEVTFIDPKTKARWEKAIENADDGKEKPQTLKFGPSHNCLKDFTTGSFKTMAQRY